MAISNRTQENLTCAPAHLSGGLRPEGKALLPSHSPPCCPVSLPAHAGCPSCPSSSDAAAALPAGLRGSTRRKRFCFILCRTTISGHSTAAACSRLGKEKQVRAHICAATIKGTYPFPCHQKRTEPRSSLLLTTFALGNSQHVYFANSVLLENYKGIRSATCC